MISSSSKYAIRALKYLAQKDSDQYISIDEIAEETGVPRAYLSKLMKALAKKKIVTTKKGVKGGVIFKSDNEITFYDVCLALEDPIVGQTCFLYPTACALRPGEQCGAHKSWGKIRAQMINFLKEAIF